MKKAGQKIKSFSDWKKEMLKLAEKALAEEMLMNAASYYRAAEFYIKSNDPEKEIPSAAEKKGAIVIHGGFDSFIEEFYQFGQMTVL